MNRWSVIIGIILLCQSNFGVATEAIPPIQRTNEPVFIDIAGTVKALRQVKVADDETSIPLAIKPLLTVLKHQLRYLITLTLSSHVSETKSLESVRKALLAEFEKQGISSEKPDIVMVWPDSVDHSYTYGDIYQIAIRKIDDYPDLIAATTTIGVCCGSDASLYIYQKTNEGWKLLIAQEANDYEEVSGAQGSFDYAISPSSNTGHFFVVTKDVNPGCTSNWHGIYYQVLKQGTSPYEPKILLRQSDAVYLGNDRYGSISILPTGFTIEYDSWQRLDTGVLTRRHVMSYQVQGDQVRRVPPFAQEPEGFLDEWFDLPWEEALKWVLPSSVAPLHTLHTKFQDNHSRDDRLFSTGFVFDPPPACRVKPGQWQVGIEFEAAEGKSLPAGIPKEMYLTVAEKKSGYFLKGASRSSLPKCRLQKAYWQ